MFFVRFFRFLTGYVIFSGRNGFPERFINLCALNGINVWNAKVLNGQFEAITSISGFKNIHECAKKSGMNIHIEKECGLPFIIKPYISRKGIAVGLVLSIVLTILLSSTVWTFEVNGNYKYTYEQVIALAEHYGIYPGAFRSRINQKEIREKIKNTHNISWFSVNIDGSAVSIDIMELNDDRVKDDIHTEPCNIISGVDGEILKLDVYKGDAAVSVGNAITKGDLLISGVKEKTDGSVEFVHAKGSAIIRTRQSATAVIKNTIQSSQSKLIKNRYTISILGLKIPLGKEKISDIKNTKVSMFTYNDIILPLGIITDTYISVQNTQITLNEHQRLLLCAYTVFLNETEIMKNAKTESKNVTVEENDKYTKITIAYINHQTSGIESYFIVEDINNSGKYAQ